MKFDWYSAFASMALVMFIAAVIGCIGAVLIGNYAASAVCCVAVFIAAGIWGGANNDH